MTNCTKSPGDICPARTSRVPIHKTPTTPVKIRKITIAVITARVLIRRRAASKAFSVSLLNCARLAVSWE